MGARLGLKGLPTDPRAHCGSPLGAVTMVPPGGWSLVDNKRNTHMGGPTRDPLTLDFTKKGHSSHMRQDTPESRPSRITHTDRGKITWPREHVDYITPCPEIIISLLIPPFPEIIISLLIPDFWKSLYLCSFLLHLALIAILLHLTLLAIPCLFYVRLTVFWCHVRIT